MKYKALLAILLLGIVLFTFPLMASAREISYNTVNQPTSSDTGITLLADVIVTKYRKYNGKTQYRRWNETQNKWVDPYWINFN